MKGVQLFLIILLFALSQQATVEEGSLPCLANNVKIVCSVIQTSQDPDDPKKDLKLCMADKSLISTSPESSVSSVVHADGCDMKNPSIITGFIIKFATVKYIPTGFKTKFPSLKGLMIYESGLLSVSKSNLKEFGDSLRYLVLDRNLIIFIDADLFEFNPNLKEISFDGNPIRHINPDFFTNLKKLKFLQLAGFNSCGCIDQKFNFLRQNISTFIWKILKCRDLYAKTEIVSKISHCVTQQTNKKLEEVSEKLKKWELNISNIGNL